MAGAIAGTAILNMSGAIAGTAINEIQEPEKGSLNTVTLTVNDYCNLDCDYCYLRSDSDSAFVGEDVLELLERSDFRHLAIVGKEPLINRRDARLTLQIVERFGVKDISASIITNGIGLKHVTDFPDNLAYIDVSFDGGPETFKAGSRIDYSELAANIDRLASSGPRMNALQTLYGENLDQVDSMMQVREIDGLGVIMFSPYIDTRNYGNDGVSKTGLSRLLTVFSESDRFREDRNSIALIDKFHIEQDGIDFNQIREQIESCGLQDKVRVIEEDPLAYGIVRVTHDGLVLTPEQSLHVRDYAQLRSPNQLQIPLETTYEKMVA